MGKSSPRPNPIILVAGGTGGHIFPAAALARELHARGYTLALFTDRPGGYGGDLDAVDTHRIRAGRVTTGGLAARLRGAAELALGALQARRLLRELSPSIVVGFGGYASVPTMLAATRAHIATVIHEQNALLGRANRWLARSVTAIATSFADVAGIHPQARRKVTLTGNPVRQEILALRDQPYPAPQTHGSIRLLVLGGSQGATVFSDVIPAALARLTRGLRTRLKLRQQCRPEDIARVRRSYANLGVEAELAAFFEDMPQRLGDAHLVICRAGATTVAELTAAGRPAILVPFPHALDDHQTANARAVQAGGGAVLMPQPTFTPQTLSARLKLLLDNPLGLRRMAERSRGLGQPQAAARLADLVASLCPSNGEEASNSGPGAREEAA